MSVSLMRLSAAVMFSVVTDRLLMVCSSLFWIAPRSPLVEETVLTASLILAMDLSAVPCSAIPTFFKPSMPRPFALMLSTLSVIASTCFGYHCQEHSLIFFEVCIGAHGLVLRCLQYAWCAVWCLLALNSKSTGFPMLLL